jgi:transcriptional regulator with XRE-family HTH domain
VAKGVSLPRDWSSMRELRLARGLSQTRLAELSGVSERTVRAFEAGTVSRPQHESLRRIAAVLAYGESHQRRLVERWTGNNPHITPDVLRMPDWEVIHRRIGVRQPGDGGQVSTVLCDLTIGADRLPQHVRWTYVHEQMGASGSPVLWKMNSGMPVDLSGVRFEVLTGGVLDDFFVHDDIAALAIRPDPLLARKGPFVVEYAVDLSGAVPVDGAVEREWMHGGMSPLQVAAMVVRFTDEAPPRVWSVTGRSATATERRGQVQVGRDGVAQVCFHDLVGVFGLQWEWDDETPAEPT